MDTEPLRKSLEALASEASSLEARVATWRYEMEAAEQRLVHIRGAVRNLEFILGIQAPKPVVNLSGQVIIPGGISVGIFDDERHSQPARSDFIELSGSDGGQDVTDEDEKPPLPQPRRRVKRTRSTEWIAEIVNMAGRPMTRDEIYAEFEAQRGFPESWSNPRNSLGNALGRAVANKWVVRMSDDRYIGADMFANPFGSGGDDGA